MVGRVMYPCQAVTFLPLHNTAEPLGLLECSLQGFDTEMCVLASCKLSNSEDEDHNTAHHGAAPAYQAGHGKMTTTKHGTPSKHRSTHRKMAKHRQTHRKMTKHQPGHNIAPLRHTRTPSRLWHNTAKHQRTKPTTAQLCTGVPGIKNIPPQTAAPYQHTKLIPK